MKYLFLSTLILLPGIAQAQQAVDVVTVRDNFIVAEIAAQKCNANDPGKRETHYRNFTLVSRKAMEAIVARAQGAEPEELRKKDLAHIERLQDATLNLIRSEGCKSEKVRALLRMHYMHGTIRF